MQETAIQWIGYAMIAVPILGGIIGALWLMWRKDKAAADRQLFLQGVQIIYGVVNNIAAMTENKVDDKAAEFLKRLKDYLEMKGVEVTPEIMREGQLIADAIHGNAKVSDAPKAELPPH